jgi:acyl-CoA hydrolase
MDSYIIVRTEHLNQHGFLFGGQMLLWIDEFCWIAAAMDFPEKKLVTRAMGETTFNKGIPNGSILRFDTRQKAVGCSSATYSCDVYIMDDKEENKKPVFSTTITFTAVGKDGKKTSIC